MTLIKNNSGWRPVGHAVLVKAMELEEKQSSIHIPKAVRESAATGEMMGVVVALGADCWNGEGETPRATVGDIVLVTRYSGGILSGSDGATYKMVPDHAIYAVKE